MQPDHYQKIQGLVKAATLFSSAEKSEWQQLLELMNDRQLLELERILTDVAQRENAAAQKAAVPAQVLPKPVPATIPQKPAQALPVIPTQKNPIMPPKPPVPMPAVKQTTLAPIQPKSAAPYSQPFTHILNFPQSSANKQPTGKPAATAGNTAVASPQVTSKQVEPKKESVFLAKLKGIFAEKELPSGELLELSAPSPKSQTTSAPSQAKPLTSALQAHHEKPKPIHHIADKLKKPEHAEKLHAPAKAPDKIEDKLKILGKHKVAAKRDNVTINLIMNSPGDLAKMPGLAQAGQALQDAFGKQAPSGLPVQPAQPVEKKIAEAPQAKTSPNLGQAPVVKPSVPANQPPAPAATPSSAFAPSGTELLNRFFSNSKTVEPAKTQDTTVNFVSVNPKVEENLEAKGRPGTPDAAARGSAIAAENKAKDFNFERTLEGMDSKMRAQGSGQANVALGLNFPEMSMGGILQGRPADTVLQSETPQRQVAKISIIEKPGDDMKLDTLAEVAGLKAADLKQHATGTFFKRLNNLIRKFGYHEVVFNLEKSPLYKTYVTTGLTLLNGGLSFEKKTLPAEDYLEKSDFEHFADLLIVLQSGV